MNWVFYVTLAVVFIGFFLVRRMTSLSPEQARSFLKAGAAIVDVRNPEEFAEEHLPGAVNIPLGVLKEEAERLWPKKEQILLLHCVSGMRSGIGVRILKQQGYSKAYNLGTYGRAKAIACGNS
jgi:phage shock protein E